MERSGCSAVWRRRCWSRPGVGGVARADDHAGRPLHAGHRHRPRRAPARRRTCRRRSARRWSSTTARRQRQHRQRAVARAKPDGYTLLMTVNTIVMNESLFKTMPYDPVTTSRRSCRTSYGTLLLVTNPAVRRSTRSPGSSRAAKAHPGQIKYGSPGNGTPHHLAMELCCRGPAPRSLHIPYKGTRRRRHRDPRRPGSTHVHADARRAAADQGRQAGRAGHRQREAVRAAAERADARRGRHPDRQPRHVVRRARPEGHAARDRRPRSTARSPRVLARPDVASGLRDAGHGAGAHDPGGLRRADREGRRALGRSRPQQRRSPPTEGAASGRRFPRRRRAPRRTRQAKACQGDKRDEHEGFRRWRRSRSRCWRRAPPARARCPRLPTRRRPARRWRPASSTAS